MHHFTAKTGTNRIPYIHLTGGIWYQLAPGDFGELTFHTVEHPCEDKQESDWPSRGKNVFQNLKYYNWF